MRMDLNRRSFLRSTALAAGAGLTAACGPRRVAVSPPAMRLPKVSVSEERIIRTVTGLRPFRPSGFVLRGEKIGDKTVVHNYGHGGCGVTLSWGTAALATAEVQHTGAKSVAVLGAGAVGLATTRLLLERGFAVTVYAKD